VRLRKSGNSSAPDAMSVRHASHGVNATVFIEFVTRLIAGAKREFFDRRLWTRPHREENQGVC
jgi:hypothetical protein